MSIRPLSLREALGIDHAIEWRDRAAIEADAIRARASEEGRALGRAEVVAHWLGDSAEMATLREQVSTLALEVATVVLGREARLDAAVLTEMVARAMAKLPRARAILFHVHPDDVEAARASVRALVEARKSSAAWDVVADGAVSRGGVVAEADIGRADARIETQLEAIARAWAGA